MKSKYDRHLSGLEVRSSNVVCRDDGSPSPAMETLTIIEEGDEGVSKRASSFVIKFAHILL